MMANPLTEFLDSNHIGYTQDPQVMVDYQHDESRVFQGQADMVIFPKNETEIKQILQFHNQNKIKLHISGARTGITGSCCPISGGSILSLEKIVAPFQDIPTGFETVTDGTYTIYLNTDQKRAVVPPSLRLNQLDVLLAEYELMYPPDPTEITATIGGTCATNASGARSFRFGPTRDWIDTMRVIVMNGECIDFTQSKYTQKQSIVLKGEKNQYEINMPLKDEYPYMHIKNAAGLFFKDPMRPIDLFIGSEGILGVFSDITVKLMERIEKTFTFVCFFSDEEDALAFVSKLKTEYSQPFNILSIEYLGKNALDFIRDDYPNIPNQSYGVFFEIPFNPDTDEEDFPSDDIMETLDSIIEDYNSIDTWLMPPKKREEMRVFRHILPEKVNAYMTTRSGKIGTDIAVPDINLKKMMAVYHQAAEKYQLKYVIFGHIGSDHVHVNLLPNNAEELENAKRCYREIAEHAIKLGGTLSAEHGVGKKTVIDAEEGTIPYLKLMINDKGLNVIKSIKASLDSHLLLNSGNMVAAPKLK